MKNAVIGTCIFFYSTAFEIVRRALLPLLASRGRKKNWDIDKRGILPPFVREHRPRTAVWLHAASLGEAKLLLQFLEVLEKRNPDDSYVVTATSRSGVHYLERMKRPSICAIGFLPFDTLPLMTATIKKFGITRLWLLETELWPAMLWTCRRCGVPVGIANARIEEKSFVKYRRFRPVFRSLFRSFDVILAQHETYARRFLALGARPESMHITGNMKGHIRIRSPLPKERAALRAAMRLHDREIVVTAGCLHEGEGALLRECLRLLAERGRVCKCIVVPRHLDKSAAIAREFGPGVVRLADIAAENPWVICTVEKFGILEAMYKIADVAVVGGSFIEVGGHNVWEPARFGIPVFFGPHYFSQQSSCERLLAAGVGFKAQTAEELAAGIERALFTEPGKFASAQSVFAEHVNRQETLLEPLIP
jgi:3-deoxy-D-manno-octulosonic-acid transferase